MKNERIIKVSSITRVYGTQSYYRNGYSKVPFIRLAGRYIEKIGINIGDSVKVEFIDNQIIISKI